MEETKELKKLSKETINIIRTAQRNNIELTNIADNKANVLLSLNALMITFLLPQILANTNLILAKYLHIPLIILGATCLVTIFMSAIVLMPGRFDKFKERYFSEERYSPFFFGNFYKMEPNEFFQHIQESMEEASIVRRSLAQDLYYVGRRLGFKMTWIRRAFKLFLVGMFLSISSTLLVLFFL